MTDRLALRTVVAITCIGAALSCFCLWGFATNDVLLILFSLGWGATGLSSTGFWSKMILDAARQSASRFESYSVKVRSDDDVSATGLVFAIFSSLRGVGNLTSGKFSTSRNIDRIDEPLGPISDALRKVKQRSLIGAPGGFGFMNYVSQSSAHLFGFSALADSSGIGGVDNVYRFDMGR